MSEQLTLWPLLPEIIVSVMACVVLLVGLYGGTGRDRLAYGLSIATLVAAAVAVAGWSSGPRVVFSGMFLNDELAGLIKVIICLLTIGVFIYSRDYARERGLFRSEYFVLGLFGVVGMMVIASAGHFLTLYLGLELLSLCLYSMVALQRDSSVATEASMKYFVLGALASGILLYGLSILYGVTGSLEIDAVRAAVSTLSADNLVLVFGLVFVVVSLTFKLGAVPFHMWVPDVYQGSPTSTTVYIGTAPKLAAFALVIRLLVGGLEDLHGAWRDMLIVIALLSIGLGNVAAIAQTNIKRMLAYSTISHMGFFLLGVLAGTPGGYSAALFYVIVYAVMSLGAFGIIILLSREGFEADRLDDFRGLSRREPWYAFLMLLLMFSMAGIPPTVGFYAKLSVLQAVVSIDQVWVAVVAVLFAVVGAFYYLRIVKLMYFDEPAEHGELRSSRDLRAVLAVNALGLVLVMPWVDSILRLCRSAIVSLGS